MLDTNICSFIMRSQPSVASRFASETENGARIVISVMSYAELRFGATGPKASPRLPQMVTDFVGLLDGVLPWDVQAADITAEIRRYLRLAGKPIGDYDSAIAGHALAADATLVTNNTREFSRVDGLRLEDWTL